VPKCSGSAACFSGGRLEHQQGNSTVESDSDEGEAVGVIQTFVGHLSARMVRHYTHITTGAARKAVELLDAQPILAPTLTGRQELIR
jgi:hypothetical protein